MPARLDSLGDISKYLRPSDSVYVSGCAAEIPHIEEIFPATAGLQDLRISGIFIPNVNSVDYTGLGADFRCRTFFMTPALAASAARDRVDYCPWRYRDVIDWYQRHPVDVAVVMLSPSDRNGRYSFGIGSDYSPIVMATAKTRIGVINQQMPVTLGTEACLPGHLDALVEINEPLIQVAVRSRDSVAESIARHIRSYVGNGATLQLGVGSLPGAVAKALQSHSGLRVWSGLVDDAVMSLEKSGVLDPDHPIVGGAVLGSSALYEHVHQNERYRFCPVTVTHDLETVSRIPNFIAINGALEVDLLGQVNSFVTPRGFVSGPGGLPEFVNGALRSRGGRSIIALNATAKGGEISRIVPRVTGSVASIPASDADVVVTEFGAAELRGKSLRQRIRALIQIADPAQRETLEHEAARLG